MGYILQNEREIEALHLTKLTGNKRSYIHQSEGEMGYIFQNEQEIEALHLTKTTRK